MIRSIQRYAYTYNFTYQQIREENTWNKIRRNNNKFSEKSVRKNKSPFLWKIWKIWIQVRKKKKVSVNKNGPGAQGPLDPLKKTSLSLIRPTVSDECHVNSIMLLILFHFSFSCQRFLGVWRIVTTYNSLPSGESQWKINRNKRLFFDNFKFLYYLFITSSYAYIKCM